MNRRLSALLASRPARRTPFSGIALVFRRQMRGRNAWRDLLGIGLLLAAQATLVALVAQSGAFSPDREYTHETTRLLQDRLLIQMVCAPFLLLSVAAVLGAGAVPPQTEFEATQSALLTRLTPLDLCAGRLLAGLWVPFGAILASCALWLAANLWLRFEPGALHGFGPIFQAHFVLLLSVGMIGALGFLAALRHRPGRAWGRGVGLAMLFAALCLTALIPANSFLMRQEDPTRWIYGLLLINPSVAAGETFQADLLRTRWLYDHTGAHEFPFAYPPWWASAGLYTLVGLGALGISTHRFRRAYR